jgi:hypothetical protein
MDNGQLIIDNGQGPNFGERERRLLQSASCRLGWCGNNRWFLSFLLDVFGGTPKTAGETPALPPESGHYRFPLAAPLTHS